ncbi:HAD family hydrolase [Stappia indica]|uniref:2-haloacid dehalogenase n=1 Tax=Stappia indica TaxID=538381 RepID=A0A285T8G0_9HYPH|nr:HAD family phosphatase [Stappia indica]SOC17621.1 2-haloacid dehalogenase [Stappia indica]
MANRPDTVVFDIGNVLIQWDPRLLYRSIFQNEADADRFLAEVLPPEWNLEQDRGRSFAEGIAEALARRPDHREEILAWDTRWHEMVPGEVPGSGAILTALKEAGVPLYAITNFSSEKFAECEQRFPFLADSFIDVVVSAHERLVKPDPRIYHVLFSRNALAPERTVFIDDSPANVAAARSVGMHAIHFTDAASLKAALVEQGFPL